MVQFTGRGRELEVVGLRGRMAQQERNPTLFVAPESVLDEGRLIEFVVAAVDAVVVAAVVAVVVDAVDAVVVDSLQEVELVQDVVDADADLEFGSLLDVAFEVFRHFLKLWHRS